LLIPSTVILNFTNRNHAKWFVQNDAGAHFKWVPRQFGSQLMRDQLDM
jgi:hypothetical protein